MHLCPDSLGLRDAFLVSLVSRRATAGQVDRSDDESHDGRVRFDGYKAHGLVLYHNAVLQRMLADDGHARRSRLGLPGHFRVNVLAEPGHKARKEAPRSREGDLLGLPPPRLIRCLPPA